MKAPVRVRILIPSGFLAAPDLFIHVDYDLGWGFANMKESNLWISAVKEVWPELSDCEFVTYDWSRG